MRCENCGWDNPNENSKCEKCGAQLGKSTMKETAQQTTQNFSDGGFDPKKTVKGCPECGYMVRPGESQCPQCGHGESVKPINQEPQISNPPFKGTVIRKNEETPEQERSAGKKVVGFLVTYSHTELGEFFPLYEGKNYVGKESGMNVHIKNDNAISSKHCCILYRTVDSKFKFKDEQSTNGTFINNELIDEGELTNNDIISIGDKTKLVFMVIPRIEEK